jgi:type II restriction/modification system DNA methylase subunit YeeA
METTKLRRFAQYARATLLKLVDARLQLVLMPESVARRENPLAVRELETKIRENGPNPVVDRVAYIWFNRFCALRYMDVNRVNRISVVSPLDGQFQPEILSEAKMGHIDEEMVPVTIQAKVRALLDGTAPSPDPQQEAYRLLVVAACNYWQQAMPFLFEAIADYTELLMPDDLLSGNSILSYTREAMTPDACQDVEVIGWLYQFYISEKKDEVFEGLKKNKKITPENIPAATQLFTPHWIVRYLVENSLGRLWLLNRPNSKLAGQMDYYIAPQEPLTDFLHIAKPEDIKLCDPACGSGHMLTYAFDLLYAIYEEEGTDPVDIPEKILTHNLYGIEIDERAAELAAFALTMKARSKQRRFLNKRIQPNICVLRPVKIAPQDMDAYVAEVGRDLFTANLRTLLTQFEEADNFGSLIRPVAMDYVETRRVLAENGIGNQLLLEHVHSDVLRVLEQSEYLSQRYQVVVANPPYMGSGGMNGRLLAWAKESYSDSKSDLFAMFIERNTDLAVTAGFVSMITMQSWMFLSSYENLRAKLLNSKTLTSLAHLGPRAFDSIGGEVVSTTAFVLENARHENFKGSFLRLIDGASEAEKDRMIREAIRNSLCGWFHRAASADFRKIPGVPIAYWLTPSGFSAFAHTELNALGQTRRGLQTGDKDRFIRNWFEVCFNSTEWNAENKSEASKSQAKWFRFNNGGEFRKWYGNLFLVVDWACDGRNIKESGSAIIPSESLYFDSAACWSRLSTGNNAFRVHPSGVIPGDLTPCFYSEYDEYSIAYLNSHCANYFLNAINPTITKTVGDIGRIPTLDPIKLDDVIQKNTKLLINSHRADWVSNEISWDFQRSPLLVPHKPKPSLKEAYTQLRTYGVQTTKEVHSLEEENNRIFIEAYGLQDELPPDVPLSEITLTCNPYYRYGGDKSDQELEYLLCADTMREFISYAVGCMFGRYSLDQPGLILANQGETLKDYLRQVPEPRFMPDADNVIPLLGGDWFSDDITGRFREFLRLTFGDEHYDENLHFVETALGKKGKPQLIRDFFLKEFYTDHVKRYKKRPIYWLFSSPKGGFNALIYLHRYRPDTASIVLQYLRDFRSKLVSERDHQEQMSISGSASPGEKTKALKRIEELKKILAELDDYECETLYPLATHQVALDLDDGVKVNYVKLGAALKKIPGLDSKDEE